MLVLGVILALALCLLYVLVDLPRYVIVTEQAYCGRDLEAVSLLFLLPYTGDSTDHQTLGKRLVELQKGDLLRLKNRTVKLTADLVFHQALVCTGQAKGKAVWVPSDLFEAVVKS